MSQLGLCPSRREDPGSGNSVMGENETAMQLWLSAPKTLGSSQVSPKNQRQGL